MAQEQSIIVETNLFISRTAEPRKLTEAIEDCAEIFHGAIALLYSPHKCFLATVNSNGRFQDNKGEIDVKKESVFEARVFNEVAELRWLNEENGEGAARVLCEDNAKKFFNIEPKADNRIYAKIEPSQSYLVWGESVGESKNGWTRFAEARIGSFYVPVDGIRAGQKSRAQFKAIEYLGEFEDGNVVVCEERLCGVEPVTAKEKNHG